MKTALTTFTALVAIVLSNAARSAFAETANAGGVATKGCDATIRVVQWNIGHFAMGRSSRTAIEPEQSAARSAEYRAEIARLKPDFLGVSEFDPVFDEAGRLSTNEVFAAAYKELRLAGNADITT